MSYTEKQLKEATQIAYLSFLEKAQDNLIADGKKEPFSIEELIFSYLNISNSKELLREKTMQEIVKESDMSDFDKSIIEEFSGEMFSWKIIDIHDTQDDNGFYGCVIETSNKEAIVAFRGSENMKKYTNLRNDWIRADFGLLNSKCTNQQKEVEIYADELIENKVLDKYDALSVTGHSLGGNLASHFTVASADEKRKNIYEKIERTINFDGPGVSKEYLENYDEQVKKAGGKIDHYKWSAVGSLLNEIPGSNNEFIGIDEKQHNGNLIDRIKYKIITRHSTKSLVFDKNGNAFRGHQDLVAKSMSVISKAADEILPETLTGELYAISEWVFDNVLYEKEDGSIGFKNPILDVATGATNAIVSTAKKFIGNMIGTFKETALSIDSAIVNGIEKLDIPKDGYNDVLIAAEMNQGLNWDTLENATNIFKDGRNEYNLDELNFSY